MRRRRLATCAAMLLACSGWGSPLVGQESQSPTLPDRVPPPLPRRERPEDSLSVYRPLVGDSSIEWGLPDELLPHLYEKATLYAEYTRRFTCNEIARVAEYDRSGQVESEKERRYGYLLVKDPTGETLREYRQEYTKAGRLKPEEVRDAEPFPPAYAWVYLFSRFNEPYFAFRLLADRFDGFDWVYEIEFRGSLPFTDGKDIRQWQGTALIDAVTYTPLEILAEPAGQRERIEALYEHWSRSFNLFGVRTAPQPLGYRAHVQFRYRREGLNFPTHLRYDTFQASGRSRIVPVRASVRSYDDYRITRVTTGERVGEAATP